MIDMGYYILKDYDKIVEVDNVLEWAEFFSRSDRVLYQRRLPGGVFVSTVFLGIDHGFAGEGDPVLFETMVFGGRFDQLQERYCTRKQAVEGHFKIKLMVMKMTPWYDKFTYPTARLVRRVTRYLYRGIRIISPEGSVLRRRWGVTLNDR